MKSKAGLEYGLLTGYPEFPIKKKCLQNNKPNRPNKQRNEDIYYF